MTRRPCRQALRAVVVAGTLAAMAAGATPAGAQEPTQPGIAESPTITVLKGLMVPQFEVEMRHFVQALGVNCGGCHVPRNFASEDNPRKAIARRMIEMTRDLNSAVLPEFHAGRRRVVARPRHLLHLPSGHDAAGQGAGRGAGPLAPTAGRPDGCRAAR